MMFIYKTVKFGPVWTTILKIGAIFVYQTLTECALYQNPCEKVAISIKKYSQSSCRILLLHKFYHLQVAFMTFENLVDSDQKLPAASDFPEIQEPYDSNHSSSPQ